MIVEPLSRDHTADDIRERERIGAAGGTAFEVYDKRQDGSTVTVGFGASVHALLYRGRGESVISLPGEFVWATSSTLRLVPVVEASCLVRKNRARQLEYP